MLGELFDPKADTHIYEHCRPHWSQAGAVVFITFRLADSIPQEVLERWEREKQEWLRVRGYDNRIAWQKLLPLLTDADREDFRKTFNRCREDFLDTCHGACILRRPELAKIVSDSLLYFDRQRYRMGDFVVMPNHVHLLTVFVSEAAMKTQCDSWLHYTAYRINPLIGSKGKLWQQEPFDHLVRSVEQYDYLRDYIRKNPEKAKLKAGEYVYRRFDG
jgi:type I restriction enzyme R subunit